MNAKYPFYCPECGSYDRRNWSTGGCRYFDDHPEWAKAGIDPPCALSSPDRPSRFGWWIAGVLVAGFVVSALLAFR
jgi:hypothetical protein